MASAELLGVTVATIAILFALLAATGVQAQGPLDTIVINNDLPSALSVQCESDTTRQAVDMMKPTRYHEFHFDPNAHKQWVCTLATTPGTSPPRRGRFVVWAKQSSFKPCEHICIWFANAAGLSLVVGSNPVHIYNWP